MLEALLSSPWLLLAGFLGASVLMLGCLNHMERQGFEGTVLGTLVIPYCSGAPNVFFVIALARRHGPGEEVVVNALVNNITNLTLLIGLPALIWGLHIIPRGKVAKKAARGFRLSRLSLALTLVALLVFTGITWALGMDGELSVGDGLTLIALFLFWQLVEVFNVLRTNVETGRKFGSGLVLDFIGILVGAALMFVCIDGLTAWISQIETGFISYRNVGWLSGWLTVLPNAVPAFYYAAIKRADIVYSSQVGDGHICIPLCIGIGAVLTPIPVSLFFSVGMGLTAALGFLHLGVVTITGSARRVIGALLLVIYAIFVYKGLFAG
ncbi:MAG: sodium:calcium symporter [Lentisphaeria bacterium]|nr:sodium:calcium symporter [Lentisphaeria bacterium]